MVAPPSIHPDGPQYTEVKPLPTRHLTAAEVDAVIQWAASLALPDETPRPTSFDVNGNMIPDECDIEEGLGTDCNSNGIIDEYELTNNDCNDSQLPDDCELMDNDYRRSCGPRVLSYRCVLLGARRTRHARRSPTPYRSWQLRTSSRRREGLRVSPRARPAGSACPRPGPPPAP